MDENLNNLTVSGSHEKPGQHEKKKPGRPKGSTNKPKTAKENQGSGSTSRRKQGRKTGQAAKQALTVQQEKRKRGRPKGSIDKMERKKRTDNKMLTTEPGDNTKILQYSITLSKLPKIDVNNLQSVQARIDQFFSICAVYDIKPAVASLALSFGINRITLFNWLTGKTETVKNRECLNSIKNAYDIINSQYEILMNTGKINPVAGIFLMKNNMGYKDTTDHVIMANQDNTLSLTDISNRAGLLDE